MLLPTTLTPSLFFASSLARFGHTVPLLSRNGLFPVAPFFQQSSTPPLASLPPSPPPGDPPRMSRLSPGTGPSLSSFFLISFFHHLPLFADMAVPCLCGKIRIFSFFIVGSVFSLPSRAPQETDAFFSLFSFRPQSSVLLFGSLFPFDMSTFSRHYWDRLPSRVCGLSFFPDIFPRV